MTVIETIPAEKLGQGSPIALTIVPDEAGLFRKMAEEMFAYIKRSAERGEPVKMVIPVGPTGQYPYLLEMINREKVSCRNVIFFLMDEYCTKAGEWIPQDHPLSFRGFIAREFLALLDPELRPLPQNVLTPDPKDPTAYDRRIAEEGGIDVVFGGIGINGHVAFNEPEPSLTPEEYLELGSRVLEIAPETRVINASNAAGGNLEAIPEKCVTIGFKQIFSAKRICLYSFRTWQRAVVRRGLHGPITAACPLSLLQKHHHVSLMITENAAQPALPPCE